jgi:hypothetical protein
VSLHTTNLPNEQDYEQLTLFPEDSHASHFPWLESKKVKGMTVISGQKCLELYRNSGPLGCLVKMLLESSVWHSTKCYLIWKVRVTKHKRLLFQLVPLVPYTDGTESLLLPTPVASDYKGGRKQHRWRKATNSYRDYCRQIWGLIYPNPKLTEIIMGFPAGWTGLNV